MRHWRIYGSRTSEQVSNRLLSKYVKRGGSKAGSMHVQLPDPLHNYRAPQNRDRTCRRQVMRSWASPGKMGIGGRKGGFLERGLREKQGRRWPPALSKRQQGHMMRVARSPRGALSGRGNRSGRKVRKDSAAGFDLHLCLDLWRKTKVTVYVTASPVSPLFYCTTTTAMLNPSSNTFILLVALMVRLNSKSLRSGERSAII